MLRTADVVNLHKTFTCDISARLLPVQTLPGVLQRGFAREEKVSPHPALVHVPVHRRPDGTAAGQDEKIGDEAHWSGGLTGTHLRTPASETVRR